MVCQEGEYVVVVLEISQEVGLIGGGNGRLWSEGMVCGPEFGVQARGRPKEVCRTAGLTVGWLHPPMGHGHRAQPTGVVLGVRGQGLGLKRVSGLYWVCYWSIGCHFRQRVALEISHES